MEIIKLDENYLEAVSELFTRNYMKVREKQNILPEKYTNKEVIFELLHDLYTKSTGFVAIDNNDVFEVKRIKQKYQTTKEFAQAKEFLNKKCKEVWEMLVIQCRKVTRDCKKTS